MPDAARHLLRAAFLLAVLAFAYLGLRGRFGEVGEALAEASPAGVLGALVLVVLGLLATGLLWLRIMASLGATLPWREGLSTFFVGQLGKYVPGSVWSIGAQASLARSNGVPVRTTVTAGLVFLGYHVATAVVLGCSFVLLGVLATPWPLWLTALGLVGCLAAMSPPVVRLVSRRTFTPPTASALLLMALAWAAYSGALVLLTPTHPWDSLGELGAAFALAYAAGVSVVIAPAGVGAREALFVLLLTPLLGVPAATALALLARVVHTAADGLMAAGWWAVTRRAVDQVVTAPRQA